MLFLVISTPRAQKPSEMTALRQQYWDWLEPLQKSGAVKLALARVGRGAVVLFDVDDTATLHRYINEWQELIPATFETYPLLDIGAAKQFLDSQVG